MDKLRSMQIFREVCRQGSFSGAADTLELANSAVSRQVTELEKWLGVKLLYRTTRTLSLTDDGRVYLEKIEEILASVHDLEQQASSSQQEVKGSLNITAPEFLGRYIFKPMLPQFLQRYPDVKVSMLLVDRLVDIVEEGFDLALRVAELGESNYITRRLDSMQLKVVASPDYLQKHGTPTTPDDLKDHNCLHDATAPHNRRWHFVGPDGDMRVSVDGNLVVNNAEMVVQMATESLGIAYLPDFFLKEAIAQGILVQVLDQYTKEPYSISILYPYNRHMNLTLRTFIDYLFEYYTHQNS